MAVLAHQVAARKVVAAKVLHAEILSCKVPPHWNSQLEPQDDDIRRERTSSSSISWKNPSRNSNGKTQRRIDLTPSLTDFSSLVNEVQGLTRISLADRMARGSLEVRRSSCACTHSMRPRTLGKALAGIAERKGRARKTSERGEARADRSAKIIDARAPYCPSFEGCKEFRRKYEHVQD